MKYLHLYLLASFALLASCSKKEEDKPFKKKATLVDIFESSKQTSAFNLTANGYVESQDHVDIKAQASGKVIQVSPKLSIGAKFKANEILFTIEPDDYETALTQAEANLAGQEQALAEEEGRQVLAQKEWEFSKKQNPDIANNPLSKKLILRETQLKQARANVKSAKAQVAQAKLNLTRTEVSAPFYGIIIDESISLGKIVQSGEVLGSFANQKTYQVVASLPQKQLKWLQSIDNSKEPTVTIKGKEATWVRSVPHLDPITKMAQFLVHINPEKNPLAIGDFVSVKVQGPKLPNLYKLPKSALRENQSIWIMQDDETFQSLSVEVLADYDDNHLLIQLADKQITQLPEKIAIINSFLSTPYGGMKLTTQAD